MPSAMNSHPMGCPGCRDTIRAPTATCATAWIAYRPVSQPGSKPHDNPTAATSIISVAINSAAGHARRPMVLHRSIVADGCVDGNRGGAQTPVSAGAYVRFRTSADDTASLRFVQRQQPTSRPQEDHHGWTRPHLDSTASCPVHGGGCRHCRRRGRAVLRHAALHRPLRRHVAIPVGEQRRLRRRSPSSAPPCTLSWPSASWPSAAVAPPDDHAPQPAAWRSPSPARSCCSWVSSLRSPSATRRRATPAPASSAAASSGSPAPCRPSGSSSSDGPRCAAGVWHHWRRYTPLATGISLIAMGVVTTFFPTALHGMVGVYGLCLFGMGAALYTDPAPAAAMSVGEPQLQRA